MEELVTKYYPEKHSSVKTLQGALFAIKCFGGAAPFMFLSGKDRLFFSIIFSVKIRFNFFFFLNTLVLLIKAQSKYLIVFYSK